MRVTESTRKVEKHFQIMSNEQKENSFVRKKERTKYFRRAKLHIKWSHKNNGRSIFPPDSKFQ